MNDLLNFINCNQNNSDFNVIQYGYRKCTPGFCEPKHARQTYLMHYVYSGRGVFIGNDVSYPVQAGQAFLITPNVVSIYTASDDDPFEYRWVEFYGGKVPDLLDKADLSAENPIYDDKNGQLGSALKELVSIGDANEYMITYAFWKVAAAMISIPSKPENTFELHFKKAAAYIQTHVSDGINVTDISRYLNISRGYLSLIFNSICGKSTKQYIIDYKIEIAKQLLEYSNMTIEEIGESVGIVSSGHFSRLFKTEVGYTPLEYRRKFRSTEQTHYT